MKRDITLNEVDVAKRELEEKLQALGIGKLAKEFYDKTGIMMTAVGITWLDVSQNNDPCLYYRMTPGLITCEYETVKI